MQHSPITDIENLVSVEHLAHHIVDRCYHKGHPVTNLQLQKILYCLQFIYCRKHEGKAFLFPEEFHAWPYGPVIPSVFEEFSEWGGRLIVKSFDNKLGYLGSDLLKYLDDGIDALQHRSPWDLNYIALRPGSPWQLVYKDGAGYKCEISNHLIAIDAMPSAELKEKHSFLHREGAKCTLKSKQTRQDKSSCNKHRSSKRDK